MSQSKIFKSWKRICTKCLTGTSQTNCKFCMVTGEDKTSR